MELIYLEALFLLLKGIALVIGAIIFCEFMVWYSGWRPFHNEMLLIEIPLLLIVLYIIIIIALKQGM